MSAATRPIVVKFGSPVDIVGSIPSLLGFHPAESIVVMCLRGPRKRTGLTLRIDLLDAQHDQALAAEIVRRVAIEQASAAITVCYTEAADEQGRLPRAGLLDQIGEQLLRHGIGVAESVLVRTGRWYSYSCAGPCCPREGTP
ncbi:MAG TPA: DUF4192 domain-containing protein, partial [Jiangellaceae bacterium]